MVVAATLSTSATAEQISASDAIEKIKSRDEATISFVFGVYTGIYRANKSLISNHRSSLYCQPTVFVADGPNVIDILESFVNRFPAFKQQPVGVVMLDALVSLFPLPRLNWILTRPSAPTQLGGGENGHRQGTYGD